jgi:hypothetical protein
MCCKVLNKKCIFASHNNELSIVLLVLLLVITAGITNKQVKARIPKSRAGNSQDLKRKLTTAHKQKHLNHFTMTHQQHNSKQMRSRLKKGLIILMSGMFLSISAFAGGGETPLITDAGSASKTIREHLKFPNYSTFHATEEKVNVVFTVNDKGQVNLVVANTANQALRKLIEDQFLTLTLKQLKANNAYSIQFNFKTL